jgi:Concanavalin A-like lectin/glucanases superfamily
MPITISGSGITMQGTGITITGAIGTVAVIDLYFPYVTLLLSGDGTNTAQNNTFTDSSTNNFTITRNGTPTQGTFTPYGSNWSNYFNGSSYTTAGTIASNFLCTGSATGITATFEAWVYITVYNTGASAWMFNPVHSKGNTYFNFGVRNGAVRFYWYDGGYKNVDSASTSDVPLNTWTHIAATISGTTIKIYVNGALSTTSATYTGVAAAGVNQPEQIGYEGAGPTYFSGYISNYRFTNTVVYSAAFTPPTSPLTAVANTSLLTCQSNRFIDNSTSTFAVTVAGSPSVQRFSPFNPGSAYSTTVIGGSGYFNGTTDCLTIPSTSSFALAGDFTFECWIYLIAYPGSAAGAYLIDFRSGSTTNFTLGLIGNGTNANTYTYQNGTTFTGSTALALGTWYHYATVRSGTTVTTYLNGVSQGSMTTSFAQAASPATIGARYTNVTEFFTGYISNLRLVNGTAVYTTAFTPPTAPVSAITNTSLLLNYINAGVYDSSEMNDVITVGSAQISTTQSKFGSSSLYFNGTNSSLVGRTSPNLNMGSGDFTVECWIYWAGNSTFYQNIIGSNSASFTGNATFFRVWGTGSPVNQSKIGIGNLTHDGASSVFSVNSITANTWTHIAATRSSGIIRVFINGVLEKTGSTDTSTYDFGDNGICIGDSPWDGANGWYSGYIDDLRITKGYARYTATFTPPTAALPTQ